MSFVLAEHAHCVAQPGPGGAVGTLEPNRVEFRYHGNEIASLGDSPAVCKLPGRGKPIAHAAPVAKSDRFDLSLRRGDHEFGGLAENCQGSTLCRFEPPYKN